MFNATIIGNVGWNKTTGHAIHVGTYIDKNTGEQRTYAQFDMAVKSGRRQKTNWCRVSVFGGYAKLLLDMEAEGRAKGVKLSITTTQFPEVYAWSKDGRTGYINQVVADSYEVLTPKPAEATAANPAETAAAEAADNMADESDLPF